MSSPVLRHYGGLSVVEYAPPEPDVDAPTLVLLPSLGQSSASWAAACALLGSHARCLAVDPPGQGRSPAPTFAHTIHDHAAAVGAAVDDAGVDEVVLIGNSMGAAIATQAVLDRPNAVAGLVLVGAYVADGEPDRRAWLRERSQDLLGPDGEVREMTRELSDAIFGTSNDRWHELAAQGLRDAAPGLASALWAVYAYDTRAALGRLRLPVLSIYGARYWLLPGSAPYIRAVVPGLTEVVVDGGGHLLPVDRPEAVAEAVTDWLRGLLRRNPTDREKDE